MRITNVKAKILRVGEISEKKGFKTCEAQIEVAALKDPYTGEIIRKPEKFTCRLAIKDNNHEDLKKVIGQICTVTLNLRSYEYTFKNEQRDAIELMLNRFEPINHANATTTTKADPS